MLYTELYTDKFIRDRKHLIGKYPHTWGKVRVKNLDGLPIIELPSPQLLAGFAGYLKNQCSTRVFFRGEKSYHKTTIPSLFREIDGDFSTEISKRKKAFDVLVGKISEYKPSRFQREDIKPLLQHYGVKTDWIDLVENIFVALWFSNNHSHEKFSYIKFFIESNNVCELIIKNIIEENSSLSLRAHCQHGISATKKVDQWSIENIDFNSNLIAIAKLPNNQANRLEGYIFSRSFMFPDVELDNTYKILKRKDVQKLLDEITEDSGLEKEVLGTIS